jgi:hypothetical protein
MNRFHAASINAINRQGTTVTFKSVVQGTYNTATGIVTNTEVTTTFKAFMKHINVSQYNHPDLIGKETVEFYVAGTSVTDIKPNDQFVNNSKTYTVVKVQDHWAAGELCLYCAIAVKE